MIKSKQKIHKSRPDHCGYTLAEIAIVTVIVGSIAAYAIPNYTAINEKTRSAEGVQIISALWQANQLYILENNGSWAANVGQLQLDIVAGGNFNAPALNPGGGQFARLDRSNNFYRLYINAAGDLSCDDDGFFGARAGLCIKMGYVAYD